MVYISVCIPTFQRCFLLNALLEQLCDLVQSLDQQELFEVCISDNCSTDGTESMVIPFVKKCEYIRYHRHNSNVGFQKNLLSLATMAKGEWIFYMGDDDLPEQSLLEQLTIGSRSTNGIVLFNNNTGDGKSIREDVSSGEYSGINRILKVFPHHHPSFLSNLMFRKRMFLSVCDSISIESAYPHLIAFWEILRSKKRLTFINQQIVRAGVGFRDWQVWQPVFSSVDHARILTEGPMSFDETRINRLQRFYWSMKSIPRALYYVRESILPALPNTPYRELSFRNLWDAYAGCRVSQICACLIFGLGKSLPKKVLGLMLKSEHVHSRQETTTID
jgi:glycosyltransferase involved in cell wall biosynthesis